MTTEFTTTDLVKQKVLLKAKNINILLEDLSSANPHFLFPAKPNEKVSPSDFDNTWNNSFSKKGVTYK